MNWQPIETAPEKTDILTYAGWGTPKIGVSRFEWIEETRQEVESTTRNSRGHRIIIQESIERRREWHGEHWEPTHWMPLPAPPEDSQ